MIIFIFIFSYSYFHIHVVYNHQNVQLFLIKFFKDSDLIIKFISAVLNGTLIQNVTSYSSIANWVVHTVRMPPCGFKRLVMTL